MLRLLATSALISSAFLFTACGHSADTEAPTPDKTKTSDLSINFEKYTLDNGLDVVLHVDRSDPVVAINLAAHVGSARELPGRTGFAHLFEHLLFMDSENLGYGGLDEMNTRIGGEGTNGFTTHDMTQYYQAVPKDALEKIIWAEADKLGYFIETVNQNVVDNEKQVVKNEKRQRVDNRPYGHALYIVNKTLYPEDHPYNWQVIGSLADLDAATLADVKDFYARWYVPNNVTVTISGDFDKAEAKEMVEKYFGEIPRGEDIEPYATRASELKETKSLYYEDNFATVPQLVMVWPTVEQYHPDSYALDILNEYLTEGKRAPLNEVLIDEEKLTSDVSGFHYTKEIAGEFYLFVNPNEGEDIDNLIPALSTAFDRFEHNGIAQADLDRIKAGIEVGFYDDVQSALGKAIQLSEYNLFTDDPGFYETVLEGQNAVTPEDVMRVYNTYVKDKHLLCLSIVPKGETALKLDDYYAPAKADIVEEKIVAGEGAAVEFDPAARVIANPTPSSFDRSVEPDFGPAYDLPSPDVWRAELSNGVEIYGIESSETPLVYFSLKIDAGDSRDSYDKPAVADMVSGLMMKGTAGKTTAELQDAINALGSDIEISTSQFGTFITGNTLSRNFDATVALVEEILLEPRWDAEEFDLLKRKMINDIDQISANPGAISLREASKLRYPEGNIFHYAYYGPKEKLETVTMDDLKAFYQTNYTQHEAKLRIVGDAGAADVKRAFGSLAEKWNREAPAPAIVGPLNPVDSSQIYFYDVPGAKQSVLRIERPAMTALDPRLPTAEAMNFTLGGIYTSKLNTELRVNKGYTYGIRSSFDAVKDRGLFSVRSSVRSNVTTESVQIIRDILASYGPDFTQEDLDILKGALLRGQALKTETLDDKLGVVSEISTYGYPDDYQAQNAKAIEAMTLEDFKALAAEFLTPDAMRYVVVGDAETQAEGLSSLGYGDPIMLETE